MATLTQIEQHQRSIRDLTAVALSDLVTYTQALDPDDLAGMQRAYERFLPGLVDTYGAAAAALTADWYDELRDAASAPGKFRAVPAELPDLTRTDALAGWATATTDRAAVLSRLSGGTQRIIANAGRETVEVSTRRDPARARWGRHASANACAFCAMIATRGAVYKSDTSAGAHTRFHDRCHCVVVPVWEGQELEQPAYVKDWQDAYTAAFKAVPEGTAKYTPQLLAEMRQDLGSK